MPESGYPFNPETGEDWPLTPISDWLAARDAWSIYDKKWVKDELSLRGYSGNLPFGRTHAEMQAAIEARGLGGEFDPEEYPGQEYVVGYQIASMLAQSLTDHSSEKLGRGFSFRENLQIIRDYELTHKIEVPE